MRGAMRGESGAPGVTDNGLYCISLDKHDLSADRCRPDVTRHRIQSIITQLKKRRLSCTATTGWSHSQRSDARWIYDRAFNHAGLPHLASTLQL